jgi:uncharacterized MAPEG superfamily protein
MTQHLLTAVLYLCFLAAAARAQGYVARAAEAAPHARGQEGLTTFVACCFTYVLEGAAARAHGHVAGAAGASTHA